MKRALFAAAEENCFALGSREPRRQCSDHNRMRKIMITRIALLACLAHATVYGSETRHKLTACLQVEIPDPHLISRLAQVLATRIFADNGIPLDWRACEPAGESSQTIVVHLVSSKREGLLSGVLGYAMPGRRHIVIFYDGLKRCKTQVTYSNM